MAIWSISHVLRAEDNLSKVFNNDFQAALANAWYAEVIADRKGLGLKEKLEWLQSTLTIDQLAHGTMNYADLSSIGHEIEHKNFGQGIKMSKPEFVFDKFEKAKEAAAQLGNLAALHPQTTAIDLIKAGGSATCYDGLAFFHATHFVNGKDASNGTFSNVATGTALTDVNFAAQVAKIESYKMPNGISRNLKVTHLLHPPALKKTAHELTQAKFLGQATGGTNDNVLTNYGIKPICVPDFAGADTTWFLVAQMPGEMGRPILYSRAIDFQLTSYDGMSQAELGRLNELEWQLRGFVTGSYGHPFLMSKSTA